ncbi:MAG TPA: hypothetical protein VI197_16560 [Polyangiaceae bacterium]
MDKHVFGLLRIGPVVAALVGCTAPKMAVPAGVAKTSEVLEVSDRSSWSGSLADESFKLGRYAVNDVDRDWDSSSGFSVGPFGSEKATAGFKYRLEGGGPALEGTCASETKEKSWDVSATSEISWSKTTVACSCAGGVDAATLTWSEKVSELTVSGTTYELEPIYTTDDGGSVSDPVGFSARAGGYLGAVEVSRPGRVWLDKGLDAATKAKASCLFAGLLLYQPPSTTDD